MRKIVLSMLLLCALSSWGQTTAEPGESVVRDVTPGPWGRVRFVPLQISPPTAAVRGFLDEAQEIRWFVMVRTREEVVAFLQAAGLDRDAIQALMDDSRNPG